MPNSPPYRKKKKNMELLIKSSFYKKLVAPYEDETKRFVKSFDLEENKAIREFFLEYGFVIIRNVLNNQELDQSIDELYLDMESHSNGKYERGKADTIKFIDKFTKCFGIIGGGDAAMLPQAIKNRVNNKVFEAYKVATGRDKFICAHERYGFMIPTKLYPEFKTLEKWLHLDYNPLTGRTSTFGFKPTSIEKEITEENPLKWQNAYFQGIVALSDCPEEVGGFNCVPGFQNYCEEWTNVNSEICRVVSKGIDPSTVQIPQDDPVIDWVQKIPLRKGSLIIWDGRLAHSNFPNESELPRMVQYVKLNAIGDDITSTVETKLRELEKVGIDVNLIIQGLNLSDLQKKIVGLEPWK